MDQKKDQNNRIAFFQEMIQSVYDTMIVWHLDMDGNMLSSHDQNIRLFFEAFRAADLLSSVQSYAADFRREGERSNVCAPLILSDLFDLMYIAVFPQTGKEISDFYLLGPVFTSEQSPWLLKQELEAHQFSVTMNKGVMDMMNYIPVMPTSTLFQFASMLHACVNGKALPSHCAFPSREERTDTEEEHIDGQAEALLLRNVKEGNVHYRSDYQFAALNGTGIVFEGISPLRQAKNNVLSFISIVSRSAIEGGLPSPTAFSLRQIYMQKAETAANQTQLISVCRTMYDDFIRRVHSVRENASVSRPIKDCCAYIDLHICDSVSVSELAGKTGYSDYYLTRMFKKEMGVGILEYIRRKKTDYAKHLLADTDLSVQEISNRFSTVLSLVHRRYDGYFSI